MTKQKLDAFRPQRCNANKHTPRGLSALEKSIQQDGWIGALTVAADGETFDGSARIETGMAAGFDEAIVVESDGSKPVIVKRTDIPTADDPRAVRLGLAANRVAQMNLDWDEDVLAGLTQEMDLSDLWNKDELERVIDARTPLDFLGNEPLPTGNSVHPSEQARIPLSIVLSTLQTRKWRDYKERVGVAEDTTAFLLLLEAAQ